MGPLLEYFLIEQRRLRGGAEVLRVAAEAVGRAHTEELRHTVTAAYQFMFEELLPWQAMEDRYLLPAVAGHLGAQAASELERDHGELGTLAEQLGSLRDHIGPTPLPAREAAGLQRVLYGAYELLRMHLAKEEELLPGLERGLFGEQLEALDRLRGEVAAKAS